MHQERKRLEQDVETLQAEKDKQRGEAEEFLGCKGHHRMYHTVVGTCGILWSQGQLVTSGGLVVLRIWHVHASCWSLDRPRASSGDPGGQTHSNSWLPVTCCHPQPSPIPTWTVRRPQPPTEKPRWGEVGSANLRDEAAADTRLVGAWETTVIPKHPTVAG